MSPWPFPPPPPRNVLAMGIESMYLCKARAGSKATLTEVRQGGLSASSIASTFAFVMDFYLGNNNEVKLGRFSIPERMAGPEDLDREKKSIKMPLSLCCL